jgi:type IV pilus assembly protein PilE
MAVHTVAHGCFRQRGFTLVELMIVVAIVAILSMVAFPSYVESMRKSRRAEAKTALLDLAARQERYFTTHNAYTDRPDHLGYGSAAFPIDVRSGSTAYYRLQIDVEPGSNGWTATAEPTESQGADRCGSYTIDHLGIQGVTAGSLPAEACW